MGCQNQTQYRVFPNPCDNVAAVACTVECDYCYDVCTAVNISAFATTGTGGVTVCTHPSPPGNCGDLRGRTNKLLCGQHPNDICVCTNVIVETNAPCPQAIPASALTYIKQC
ncbi:MAG: hypothetical protein U0575_13190 [Phycisphaerales bacterium]|jgi:hypothetical protein